MIMALEWGGWWRKVSSVSPRKLMRKLDWSAFARVLRTGENSAAWAKATKSSVLGRPMVALHSSECV